MIFEYVKEVIYAQFESDKEVEDDKLLQNFFKQIGDHAYGNIVGFPTKPKDRDIVVDTISRIIW